MAAQVLLANVGLRLGDDTGQAYAILEAHQPHPKQGTRHAHGGTVIELAGESRVSRHRNLG
jgi:hypothetical protein